MKTLQILVMGVVLLVISANGAFAGTSASDCVTQAALERFQASAAFGRCVADAFVTTGVVACTVNPPTNAAEARDCGLATLRFTLHEGHCAAQFAKAMQAADAKFRDCMDKVPDLDFNELETWLKVQDIDLFIDIESIIQEIEGLIESLTGRVLFEQFFDFLKKDDFAGAAGFLEEVYGLDPETEFPNEWSSLVTAIKLSGISDYYGNAPEL